jgi:hypothetical protein
MKWVRAAALTFVLVAPMARAVEIDSFETSQFVTGPTSGGMSGISDVSSPTGSIGFKRGLNANCGVYCSVVPDSVSASIGGGSLTVMTAEPTPYDQTGAAVVWGLSGPVDLTDGGTANSFVVTVQAETRPAFVDFFLYSACPGVPDVGACFTASESDVDVNGPGLYRLRFSDAHINGTEPADFARVTGLQFSIFFPASPDAGSIQIGPLVTAPEAEPAVLAAVGLAALAFCWLPGTGSNRRPSG